MTINRKKVASSVLGAYSSARNSYANALAADRYDLAMNAGNKPVTFTNKIVGVERKQNAASEIYQAHDAALSAIDAELAKASRAMTEPPTDEAARFIIAISSRDNLSEDEVMAALDRYHGHAVEKAILSAASRSGLRGFPTTTAAENDVSDLRELAGAVDRFITPSNIETATDGKSALIENMFTQFGEGAAMNDLAAMLG